ncbi:unnamed protein product, partial [Rotaria magnacalcarata]
MIQVIFIDLLEMIDIDYDRNGTFEFNNNKLIYS